MSARPFRRPGRVVPPRAPRQGGLTLTELMVAMALGLLVTLAAGAMLVSADKAYVSQADAAGVDDGGRFALEAIGRAARQSAFINWGRDEAGPDAAAAPARVSGFDAQSLARDSEGTTGLQPGVANGSDVLALRFAGSGAAPDGDGSVLSCAGFSVSEHDDGWSIFFVAENAAGETELRCKYHGHDGWSAEALVAGVDSFQVLYGLDTDIPADGLANRFVSASEINALDAALALDGATEAARTRERYRRTHWKRVASIKVALLLHGAHRARRPDEPVLFELFGHGYSDSAGEADRGTTVREQDMDVSLRERERQLFGTTIALRNPSS